MNSNSDLKIEQINLHHSKAATANIYRGIVVEHTSVILIQEPWVNNNKVLGFGRFSNRIFKTNKKVSPRAAIYVSSELDAIQLHQFSDRDLVVVRVTRTADQGGDFLIVSCYMPDKEKVPYTDLLIKVIEFSEEKKVPILMGSDANAHHTVWGSTDINPRGTALLQFIADSELNILNKGKFPTFVTKNRKEVLDITLASNGLVDKINSWRVSLIHDFSDHRIIRFNLSGSTPKISRFRNPRRTNWEQYRDFLSQHVTDKLGTILPKSSIELDDAVTKITSLLTEAYECSCPEVKTVDKGRKKLWSANIEKLRSASRKAWNKAMRSTFQADWDDYRLSQKAFRKAVKQRARDTWRNFCAEMEHIPDYARIHKILAKDPGSLRKPDGEFTSGGEETATHLLETHFPGCGYERQKGYTAIPHSEGDWNLANRIITIDRIKWALGKFRPFKSAGGDGIFPALLKESGEILLEPLCEILRSSLALGHIPKQWETVKVTFIPKPGKPSHCVAKDLRPISLTSFILKTLERLVDFYIRDEILTKHPLHCNQHAYQVGKSTDSALHSLVSV